MADRAGFTAMLRLLRATEADVRAWQATDPARSADGSYHRECSCEPSAAVLVLGRVRIPVTVAHAGCSGDDDVTALVVDEFGQVWRVAADAVRPTDGPPAGWRVWLAPCLPD